MLSNLELLFLGMKSEKNKNVSSVCDFSTVSKIQLKSLICGMSSALYLETSANLGSAVQQDISTMQRRVLPFRQDDAKLDKLAGMWTKGVDIF